MKRLTLTAFGAFVAALVTSGFGCELLTAPDRTLIETGGAGTTSTGGGGTGGTTSSTGGTVSTGGSPTTGGGGSGGTCGAPDDCPDPGNPCVVNTCVDMKCGTEPVAAGTPAGSQTDGDCKVSQCDGAGALETVNDDEDLPADGVECTQDICTAGVPSNPPSDLDTPCGVNGALYCDGAGACVDCLDASECGVDDECKTFACDMGACVQTNANQGTLLASQTDGDCKVEQCDGAGLVESVDDNADLPVDGTTCTTDLCTAGAPSNPAVPENTSCAEGTGTLCDGDGACVECNQPTDCPGVDDECKTRTCTAGVCGFSFTAAGTAIASQTAADCKKAVCDGAGTVTSANDDTDLPTDANDCTADTCAAGEKVFTPTAINSACGAGGALFCDGAGTCQGCNTAAQCGTDDECKTFACNAGSCQQNNTASGTAVTSQVAGDCKQNVCDGSGSVTSANLNSDLPADDGNQCTDEVCTNGTASHPAKTLNTACSQNGGSFCDGAGACVQCNAAAQCPGSDTECQTRTCSAAHACGFAFQANGFQTPTQIPGDCKVRQCDGAGAFLQADANADLPADDGNQCTSEVCTAGVPSHPAKAVDTTCSQNGGSFCNATASCVQCNAATQCAGSDTECQTRTCSGAGACGFNFTANGTAVASQTAGDCKENQCNGAGSIVAANKDTDLPADDGNQCTSEVCTAGVASHPAKAVDTACSQNGGSFCNATASCVQCNAPTQCPGTDTDCQARTCSGAGACGLSFTANGTATSSQTAGDCKENQCNGAGAIVVANKDTDLPVDGNQCTDDVCTAGVATNPNSASGASCNQSGGTTCNGSGACVAAGCSNGLQDPGETDTDCGGTTCPKCVNGDSCSINSDCASNICNGGVCVECVTGNDCPGSDTECQVRTCNSNACGVSNTAAGFVVSSQTGGNCQKNQCDGNGAIVSVADNTDVPADDGNQCTDETCVAGAPQHPAKAPDTTCSQSGGTVCDGAGACVQCNGAAQCPAGNECKTATCSAAHTCGFNNQASGFVVPTQTGGNCQQNQCDGSGNVVSVADNTDVPADDGIQCTDETCVAGAPQHPAKAPDTTCSQTGGTVCDGAGACVQCNTATQCPSGNACQIATCSAAHACGFNNEANGFAPPALQTAGNCQKVVCDGAGNFGSQADNTDVPADDGIQCTDETCVAGAPQHPAKAPDTTCSQSGGTVCDGAGACVQCNSATQCPAGDECKTATCGASHTCGFNNTASGFVVTSQTSGDCKQNQCDGNGNTVPVNFDTDLPADDGNQCTGEVCTAGVSSHPALTAGTTCSQSGGTQCNGAGACVLPPSVTSTTPADAVTGAGATGNITVTFSKAMNPATLTAQTALGACTGSIQLSRDDFTTCSGFTAAAPTMGGGNTTATLTPQPALAFGAVYKVRVLGTVADAVGLTMGTTFTSPTGFTTTTDSLTNLVISQIYGGGGATGAPYKNDFIELHNRGNASIALTGTWSLQYTSAAGTAWSSNKLNLTGSVPAGGYFLVQAGSGGSVGAALPTPDQTWTLDFSATAGKMSLVASQTGQGPTICPDNATDFIGFGTANCSEGSAPSLGHTATLAGMRKLGGCLDTTVNGADFSPVAPAPRNSASAILLCSMTLNEKNVANELDFCNVQFPTSLDLQTGTSTPTIYAQAYEAGVTDPAGPAVNLVAQIGYGPTTANPENEAGWSWTSATFNVNDGNNDEWQAQFTAPTAGTYRYGARFSFNGFQWTYCELNGAGSNAGLSFETSQLPVMNVTP